MDDQKVQALLKDKDLKMIEQRESMQSEIEA